MTFIMMHSIYSAPVNKNPKKAARLRLTLKRDLGWTTIRVGCCVAVWPEDMRVSGHVMCCAAALAVHNFKMCETSACSLLALLVQ